MNRLALDLRPREKDGDWPPLPRHSLGWDSKSPLRGAWTHWDRKENQWTCSMRFGDGDEVGKDCVEYIYVVNMNELEALDEEYLVHPRLDFNGNILEENAFDSDDAVREWLRKKHHFIIPEIYMRSHAPIHTAVEIKEAWTAFMAANKNRRHDALAAVLFCVHSMDTMEGLMARRDLKSIPLVKEMLAASTLTDYSPGR
jgi:hypothetical protein